MCVCVCSSLIRTLISGSICFCVTKNDHIQLATGIQILKHLLCGVIHIKISTRVILVLGKRRNIILSSKQCSVHVFIRIMKYKYTYKFSCCWSRKIDLKSERCSVIRLKIITTYARILFIIIFYFFINKMHVGCDPEGIISRALWCYTKKKKKSPIVFFFFFELIIFHCIQKNVNITPVLLDFERSDIVSVSLRRVCFSFFFFFLSADNFSTRNLTSIFKCSTFFF